MLNDQKCIQNFYHQQNLLIRKQIRQMDMQFRQIQDKKNSNQSSNNQQPCPKQQIYFLVLGPPNSGKSSLLKYFFITTRTMYFALNSNANMEISTSELPSTLIKRFDIKKSKQYNIGGLASMKQTDKKMTITGLQFESKYSIYANQRQLTTQQKTNRTFQRYTNALQIISNKTYGCFSVQTSKKAKQSYSQTFANIKIVLVVLSIVEKIQHDEMSCLKFFLSDIKEKGIKTVLVLTHIDKLHKLQQNKKLQLLEQRIIMLMKQLDIKDRDDVFCMENYRQSNWQKITQQHNHLKTIQQNKVEQNQLQTDNSNSKNRNQQQNIVLNRQRVILTKNVNGCSEKGQVQIIKQQKTPNSFTIRIPANQSLKSSQISQGSQLSKTTVSNQINIVLQNHQVNQNHESNQNNRANINIQKNLNVNNPRQNIIQSCKQISNINSEQFSLSNSNIIEVPTLYDKRIFNKLPNDFTNTSFSTASVSSHKQLKPATLLHQDYETIFYKQKIRQKSKCSQEQTNLMNQFRPANNKQNDNKKVQENNKQLIKFINNDQINYYSLKLLLKIIKQNQKYNKEMKSRKLKWFCG